MARLRAVAIIVTFLVFTFLCMPVQWLLLKRKSPRARTFPHWYHRHVARIFGIHIRIVGHSVRGEGVLLVGDTLFSLGCGRMFEGTTAQMLASLDQLAALPGDTRVCCGHEYTVANGRFASTIEPENATLAARVQQVATLRAANRPSVPGTLADELAANPFLRVDSHAVIDWCRRHEVHTDDRVARFAALRGAKDTFG